MAQSTASPIEQYVISLIQAKDMQAFSAKDKILFYKQLVYMLKGGVSILQAVDTIRSSSTNYALKKITSSISHHLNEGKPFSYAISRLPEYFDESDAAILKTGESTGNLDTVLAELAKEYTYLEEIKNRYKSALTYPIILIIMAVGAVLFLFTSVLPGILDMVASGDQQLPQITQILKGMSDFFVAYWVQILMTIVIAVAVVMISSTTDNGKKYLSNLMLATPLLWSMSKTYYLIKRARYTKLMISAGLDYVQTFRLMKSVLDVPAYKEMTENIIAGLQLGKSIFDSIQYETDLIYPNVAVMIKVWEDTANLEDALGNIISMYQEELDNQITQFSKVLEPVILIFMGMMVAFVASGIFGVVFSIMEGVGV